MRHPPRGWIPAAKPTWASSTAWPGAAFLAQLRQGATQGRLDTALPHELRLALTKRNYALEGPFDLGAFFAKKCCGK